MAQSDNGCEHALDNILYSLQGESSITKMDKLSLSMPGLIGSTGDRVINTVPDPKICLVGETNSEQVQVVSAMQRDAQGTVGLGQIFSGGLEMSLKRPTGVSQIKKGMRHSRQREEDGEKCGLR